MTATRYIIGTAAQIEAEYATRSANTYCSIEMFNGEVVCAVGSPTLKAAIAEAIAYGVPRDQIEILG